MTKSIHDDLKKASGESIAFAEMSCKLVDLGALVRADLFDGKVVVVECSQPNEELCTETIQRVFDKFDYTLKVKFVQKSKITSIRKNNKQTN